MTVVRSLVKSCAEAVLGHRALGEAFSRRTRGRDLVLGYHGVVPPGERPAGALSLQIDMRTFTEQVEEVAETFQIVSVAEMLGEPASTPSGRVAITFDDAYAGVVDEVLPWLEARGVPATVFVCPAFVDDTDESFWWDALTVPGEAEPAEGLRNHALWTLAGDQERVRSWADREGHPWTEVPAFARSAGPASVKAAGSLEGIDWASHTWSHPNLAALDPKSCALQLARPRAWLRDRTPGGPSVIAYPYGLESAAVRAAAAKSGYTGGMLIQGGWTRARDGDPYGIPRLNIPRGLSINGLRLRLRRLFA